VTTSDSTPPISVAMALGLAHALRTPVGVIDGVLAEIGASSSVASDPSVARFAALGRRSVRQLVDLADRLEWAGRVERIGEDAMVAVDWPDLIRRCVEARCVERIERGRKRVDVQVDEAVGHGWARREANERALAELLDNAARHARTTVQVTADVVGEQLRLRIADDGPGLPSGGVDVFAPPQQPGPRVRFGLWLVERLATALHGSVGVERTGDDGTVMCLRIPLDGRLDSDPPG
jgi:two-component system, OmpR family, sensor histidine kinase KdpD